MIYGTATYYGHLRFEPAEDAEQAAAIDRTARPRRRTSPRSVPPSQASRAALRRRPDHGQPALHAVHWPAILLERADAPIPPISMRPSRRRIRRLRRAIRDLGPTGTIATAASGLRGRGGAGFPTGEKWRAAAVEAPRRYVVANGYGGSATFTDRALLELDPFAVIEGPRSRPMRSARPRRSSRSVGSRPRRSGASRRPSRPQEAGFRWGRARLRPRHRRSRAARPGRLHARRGDGPAEGPRGRGQPEQRPPYPAQRGLFDMPTVVQNVQTLAATPWIGRTAPQPSPPSAARAARARSSCRSADPVPRASRRCRCHAPSRDRGLAGKLPRGRKVKALLVGGPSGGLLPATCSTPPTTSSPCARRVPTSARGRW